ncbi:unnamed protein product [Wuchereria bancrofti]|uniref:Uncharacterized protein n=1 Tax=Wuchereria bancrofti TaxID=6293 RepID=A0A3P7EU29_WUCBA|nr:unnamed protein product [Wuchereria bancrofti]
MCRKDAYHATVHSSFTSEKMLLTSSSASNNLYFSSIQMKSSRRNWKILSVSTELSEISQTIKLARSQQTFIWPTIQMCAPELVHLEMLAIAAKY